MMKMGTEYMLENFYVRFLNVPSWVPSYSLSHGFHPQAPLQLTSETDQLCRQHHSVKAGLDTYSDIESGIRDVDKTVSLPIVKMHRAGQALNDKKTQARNCLKLKSRLRKKIQISIKYLGVILDNELNFSHYVEYNIRNKIVKYQGQSNFFGQVPIFGQVHNKNPDFRALIHSLAFSFLTQQK